MPIKNKLKPAGEAPQLKKVSFIELQEWWRNHRVSKKKETNDMMPITFDHKTTWEIIATALMFPDSTDGRQFWIELQNFKKGLTATDKMGYQYLIGENFPYIYKKMINEKAEKETKGKPRYNLKSK